MLAQNPIRKCDQLITYASCLLNNIKKNYTTIKKEALAMVLCFAKIQALFTRKQVFFLYKSYCILIFYQETKSLQENNQMVVVFLEYVFWVVYKPSHFHFVVDVLFQLLNAIENSRVPNQIVNVIFLFLLQLVQLLKIYDYFPTEIVLLRYFQEQKKMVLKALLFSLIQGQMYKL